MGAPNVKAGTVIAGRYRLIAQLSKGGMGSVWRAEHLSLGSPIAVKLIDASLVEHAEARARFEREARAAAALRSPHVVQILDHGVDRDLPFMAMELLEGESLATRLHRVRILPAAQTVRLFQDLARAVRKAHEAGIIHRDLKPDNIFLVKNDDLEIAKVLDFGIAKSQEPFGKWTGGTRTGALIGTPQYMSPEQAQGHAIDASTDLWALGVIAFECVCGRMPFPSDKPGELILQICAHPMPVPSLVARVPPRFDAWFARACSRDPKARFTSAKELAETLADVLGASPTADVSGPVQALTPALLSGAAAPFFPVGAPPAAPAPPAVMPPAASPGAPPLVGPMGTLLPAPAVEEGLDARPSAPHPPPSGPLAHDDVSTAVPTVVRPAAGAAAPAPVASEEVDAETVQSMRSGGTINGAVMDSDPATFVALARSRTKRVQIAIAAAVAALIGVVVLVAVSGDPQVVPPPETDSVAPAVSPAGTPTAVVTPVAPVPSASAATSSSATGKTASPPSTSSAGKKKIPPGAGAPKVPAPRPSASTTGSDRIGF